MKKLGLLIMTSAIAIGFGSVSAYSADITQSKPLKVAGASSTTQKNLKFAKNTRSGVPVTVRTHSSRNRGNPHLKGRTSHSGFPRGNPNLRGR